MTSDFKRSPSKVWWANETASWREISSSPGSQDSGFSDSESSPPNAHDTPDAHLTPNAHLAPNVHLAPNAHLTPTAQDTPKKATPARRVPKDIFKALAAEGGGQNLASNFKEKTTPEKENSELLRAVKSEAKLSPKRERDKMGAPNTEPVRRSRYTKNPPKVSRGLFKCVEECSANQYSAGTRVIDDNAEDSLEATLADSYACTSDPSTSIEALSTRSLPALASGRGPPNELAPGRGTSDQLASGRGPPNEVASGRGPHPNEVASGRGPHPNELAPGRGCPGAASLSAPGLLQGPLDCSQLSSDCESELEGLFDGAIESPQHTSTPKAGGGMRQRRLRIKYRQERVRPSIPSPHDGLDDNCATSRWLHEARHTYEQECMTTLQGKSIAGELNQKVTQTAGALTATLRGILSHSRCIETEYGKLNSGEFKHINPLVQSLAGNIVDFLATHLPQQTNPKILQLCDQLRKEPSLCLVNTLVLHWQEARQTVLAREAGTLVEQMENPSSELVLRGCVTGVTSLSLRNEELIEIFTRCDVIPVLLILCEKCEGSTLRGLILRALATMCCNSTAVRQFEKFSGVQIVADTLEETSRPEPERSEAVALLAQVTAPWLEDNHSVKGLQDYSRKLVRSLTKFVAGTKCCQNLLLCAAALANLSTMDSKAIKFMVHAQTTKALLEATKARGPRASIYLLEQAATLIANMSASEVARKQLIEVEAPVVLLHFLKITNSGEDVDKRLQQKSIIALSRLCGDKTAANQIVELGGVEKLVKMCREKSQRFDSDAVLVAALATLRKIIDACGCDVISALDAQELVEPKLLDSFLAYSTQNESYV